MSKLVIFHYERANFHWKGTERMRCTTPFATYFEKTLKIRRRLSLVSHDVRTWFHHFWLVSAWPGAMHCPRMTAMGFIGFAFPQLLSSLGSQDSYWAFLSSYDHKFHDKLHSVPLQQSQKWTKSRTVEALNTKIDQTDVRTHTPQTQRSHSPNNSYGVLLHYLGFQGNATNLCEFYMYFVFRGGHHGKTFRTGFITQHLPNSSATGKTKGVLWALRKNTFALFGR